MITVRPILPEELDALKKAAAADGHEVLFATHLVRKDGEIAGYASVCATPVMQVWLSSEKLHARESLALVGVGEALAADKGAAAVMMPCAPESPFNPLMERLGYRKLGVTELWVKAL